MSPIVITAPAKQDLLDISSFIARNNQDAARRIALLTGFGVCRARSHPQHGKQCNGLTPARSPIWSRNREDSGKCRYEVDNYRRNQVNHHTLQNNSR